MSTSPRRMDPRKLESAATEWKWLHCSVTGCESGRQDSNLRPLVPQTSPHFPMSTEFDLECFRREMDGMTTRARILESIGIASTARGARGRSPLLLFPANLATLGIRVAVVTIRAFSFGAAASLSRRGVLRGHGHVCCTVAGPRRRSLSPRRATPKHDGC